jgi:hypothetical protein
MEPNHCDSNHEKIMYELNEVKKKMDHDWAMIEAAHLDLVFRNRIWGIVKWAGLGTSAGVVYKLLEILFK